MTLEWIKFLSEIFDMPDRSAQFQSFKDEIEALVAERIAGVPEAERPRTLIIANYNDSALVAGGTQGLHHFRVILVSPAGGDVDFCHKR